MEPTEFEVFGIVEPLTTALIRYQIYPIQTQLAVQEKLRKWCGNNLVLKTAIEKFLEQLEYAHEEENK